MAGCRCWKPMVWLVCGLSRYFGRQKDCESKFGLLCETQIGLLVDWLVGLMFKEESEQ